MVYPVSNQAIPAANTFQPGGTADSVVNRRPEENKQVDTTKPSGTESARSQASETRSNAQVERSRPFESSNDRSADSGAVTASSSRGTQLNITV